MKNVEIERKFLIRNEDLNFDYKKYPHSKIIQGFIYLKPAIRIRKSDNNYYLTVKSKAPKSLRIESDLARTEYEIEISKKAFIDLKKMCLGRMIFKTRYFIPYFDKNKKYTIELDIFEKDLKGLIYAEIEFNSLKDAKNITIPDWFYRDITCIEKYKNTQLSICKNVKNLL